MLKPAFNTIREKVPATTHCHVGSPRHFRKADSTTRQAPIPKTARPAPEYHSHCFLSLFMFCKWLNVMNKNKRMLGWFINVHIPSKKKSDLFNPLWSLNWTQPKAMLSNFTNSYHLIFKGWKHTPTTNWSNQCAMQAANVFFNNPAEKPNPTCFGETRSPAFRVE